ncbi:hypothetical protein K491DRAFT_696709 [Lophiostoma macrostomum CBS 122681]|uniref:Uncharacterized protein n=1 Tax=Lophiostoma macrostomum CBS 122681 TaxID=1314788 RepID=A0A6A6STM7_9PLEO|nr:hypothetical protein K491DRAFT_696709 [Lophiostoma macrostomum CBS 122681]
MAGSSLLALPSELRLQIYKYLVPTRSGDCSADSIRPFCRLIKTEFDHEVLKDVAEYHRLLSTTHIALKPAETYQDTKELHLSVTGETCLMEPSYSEYLLNSLPPHIHTVVFNTVEPTTHPTRDYKLPRHLFYDGLQQLARAIDEFCNDTTRRGRRRDPPAPPWPIVFKVIAKHVCPTNLVDDCFKRVIERSHPLPCLRRWKNECSEKSTCVSRLCLPEYIWSYTQRSEGIIWTV